MQKVQGSGLIISAPPSDMNFKYHTDRNSLRNDSFLSAVVS